MTPPMIDGPTSSSFSSSMMMNNDATTTSIGNLMMIDDVRDDAGDGNGGPTMINTTTTSTTTSTTTTMATTSSPNINPCKPVASSGFSQTRPQEDEDATTTSSETDLSESPTSSSMSSSLSTDSLVEQSVAGEEECDNHGKQEQEQQRTNSSPSQPTVSVSQHQPMSDSQQNHHRPQQPYEELMIRDGPLYAIQAPTRNSSKDSLLEFGRQTKVICPINGTTNTTSGATIAIEDGGTAVPLTYRPSPMPAETTALLVVDVQKEYWSHCPAVRKDFPDFPKRLANTIDVCRRRKAKIIWVRADYRYSHSPWLLQFERMRGERNLGEVPCDPSSPEFTWEEFAKPQGGEVIIAKSSWSSTSNTALMEILRVAGIETVLVCGLITSVCVQHSAFGIFEAGYRTLLVTDACADRGRARHEAALALYGDYMYELITSEDLESEEHGLIPAQPVWLTLDANTKTVRANQFPNLQHRPSFSYPSSQSSLSSSIHQESPTSSDPMLMVPRFPSQPTGNVTRTTIPSTTKEDKPNDDGPVETTTMNRTTITAV